MFQSPPNSKFKNVINDFSQNLNSWPLKLKFCKPLKSSKCFYCDDVKSETLVKHKNCFQEPYKSIYIWKACYKYFHNLLLLQNKNNLITSSSCSKIEKLIMKKSLSATSSSLAFSAIFPSKSTSFSSTKIMETLLHSS